MKLCTAKDVDVSYLKIYGFLAFSMKPKQKRLCKLNMETELMIFIGYSDNQKRQI